MEHFAASPPGPDFTAPSMEGPSSKTDDSEVCCWQDITPRDNRTDTDHSPAFGDLTITDSKEPGVFADADNPSAFGDFTNTDNEKPGDFARSVLPLGLAFKNTFIGEGMYAPRVARGATVPSPSPKRRAQSEPASLQISPRAETLTVRDVTLSNALVQTGTRSLKLSKPPGAPVDTTGLGTDFDFEEWDSHLLGRRVTHAQTEQERKFQEEDMLKSLASNTISLAHAARQWLTTQRLQNKDMQTTAANTGAPPGTWYSAPPDFANAPPTTPPRAPTRSQYSNISPVTPTKLILDLPQAPTNDMVALAAVAKYLSPPLQGPEQPAEQRPQRGTDESRRVYEVALASLAEELHNSIPYPTYRCPTSGFSCLRWTLDKLYGNDKREVSKSFGLSYDADETVISFRLSLESLRSSFRAAKGRGQLRLQCREPDDVAAPLNFWLSAGSGVGSVSLERPRGPVHHDFSEYDIGGLPAPEATFNFDGHLNDLTQTFVVFLFIQEPWQFATEA